MASNLILSANLQSTALVNNQLGASIYVADSALSLVGNMAANNSKNEAAVTITNLSALAAGNLLSVQNGPLSNTGAVGGLGQEVFSVSSAGNVTASGTLAVTGAVTLAGGLTTTSSSLTLGGALLLNIGTVFVASSGTPTYTALATDCVIQVNTATHTQDARVNLPNVPPVGQVWIVKDVGGAAATGSSPITVTTASGTPAFDGATGTTIVSTSNFQAIRVFSDGTNYWTF